MERNDTSSSIMHSRFLAGPAGARMRFERRKFNVPSRASALLSFRVRIMLAVETVPKILLDRMTLSSQFFAGNLLNVRLERRLGSDIGSRNAGVHRRVGVSRQKVMVARFREKMERYFNLVKLLRGQMMPQRFAHSVHHRGGN